MNCDRVTCEARIGDRQLEHTPIEFELLATLAERPSAVFSHGRLLRQVWDIRRAGARRLARRRPTPGAAAKARRSVPRDRLAGIGYRLGQPRDEGLASLCPALASIDELVAPCAGAYGRTPRPRAA